MAVAVGHACAIAAIAAASLHGNPLDFLDGHGRLHIRSAGCTNARPTGPIARTWPCNHVDAKVAGLRPAGLTVRLSSCENPLVLQYLFTLLFYLQVF
ncbi:hypothetical protein [Variovorax sp. GB4R4]|uniref:hypothetical protein n=1 Tax=Variovorax sp. GB4R4 TaxID=3443739 RepID=UPI003F468A7E